MTRALGDAALSTAWTTTLLQQRLTMFNQAWQASGITDQALPPAFVIDLLSTLLREVVRPFTDLQLQMLKDQSNIFVAGEITLAGQGVDKYWNRALQPVMLQAIQARNAGAPTMAVVVPTARTASQGLRWFVNALLLEVIGGYKRLAELDQLKPWFLKLHGITDAMLAFMELAGKMAAQAKRVLAAAGAIVYAPLGALQSALGWTIKISLVGVVAYLLWKTRKAPS